jgi:hypothetical protein
VRLPVPSQKPKKSQSEVKPATDLKSHIPLFKSGHFISVPVKRLAEGLTEINDRADEIMLQGGSG